MDGTLYYRQVTPFLPKYFLLPTVDPRTCELLAGPVSIGVGGQVVLGPNDLLRCLHYPSTFFLYRYVLAGVSPSPAALKDARNGVEDGSVSYASLILCW